MDSDKKQSLPSLIIIETVAGTGHEGFLDGALSRAQFKRPFGLCRFGDSLIVADFSSHTIRQVTGVLRVAEPLAAELAIEPAEFESCAVPLMMTAVPVLPKELARLTAQYAVPNGRVTTIAGMPDKSGRVDGRALGEALFDSPLFVALDESDSMAGPRLIIGEYIGRCVRSLTLRTQIVTTIAGSDRREIGHVDGPGSEARFSDIFGVAVAPNGAVFVSHADTHLIRRISPSADRTVTTLIGVPRDLDVKSTQYSRSSAECFRQPIHPWALAMDVSDADRGCDTDQKGDTDRDVGVLYVGCVGEVHAFDLAQGKRKHYTLPDNHYAVMSLAVTEDGARLFAVTYQAIGVIDTRRGTCTVLVHERMGRIHLPARSCVIDKETRSLVMIDTESNCLIRLRGIDM